MFDLENVSMLIFLYSLLCKLSYRYQCLHDRSFKCDESSIIMVIIILFISKVLCFVLLED